MAQEILTAMHKKIRYVSNDKLYIKMLVYGEPGVGKTFLASTAPNALLLLTEPNVAEPTLQALKHGKQINIPVWDINSGQDLEDAYDYLAAGKHQFDTVIVDGLTDLNTRIKRSIMDEQTLLAEQKNRYHDPDSLELSDWGRVGERLRVHIRKFRDLQMHVVMTALATDAKDGMRVIPHIQPKGIAAEIRAYFNLVGYLQNKEVDRAIIRRLIVQETDVYAGKNPGNSLPSVVEDPDLGILFPYIINTLTGKEEN